MVKAMEREDPEWAGVCAKGLEPICPDADQRERTFISMEEGTKFEYNSN